jgi:hypothetical protein
MACPTWATASCPACQPVISPKHPSSSYSPRHPSLWGRQSHEEDHEAIEFSISRQTTVNERPDLSVFFPVDQALQSPLLFGWRERAPDFTVPISYRLSVSTQGYGRRGVKTDHDRLDSWISAVPLESWAVASTCHHRRLDVHQVWNGIEICLNLVEKIHTPVMWP